MYRHRYDVMCTHTTLFHSSPAYAPLVTFLTLFIKALQSPSRSPTPHCSPLPQTYRLLIRQLSTTQGGAPADRPPLPSIPPLSDRQIIAASLLPCPILPKSPILPLHRKDCRIRSRLPQFPSIIKKRPPSRNHAAPHHHFPPRSPQRRYKAINHHHHHALPPPHHLPARHAHRNHPRIHRIHRRHELFYYYYYHDEHDDPEHDPEHYAFPALLAHAPRLDEGGPHGARPPQPDEHRVQQDGLGRRGSSHGRRGVQSRQDESGGGARQRGEGER